METCWFCQASAAANDTAFRATLFGNKKQVPPSDGRPVDLSGPTATVTVMVPRCAGCRGRQRRETTIVLSSLAIGVFLFAGLYAIAAFGFGTPPFVWFGGTQGTVIALAVVGFLAGLLAGVLISQRANRGAPRRDARNHPDVVALTNQGWSYDPPSGD